MAFEKLEANDLESFEDGLNSALGELENRGLGKFGNEPPITIILRTTGRIINGKHEVNVVAYIDGDIKEISRDLKNTPI